MHVYRIVTKQKKRDSLFNNKIKMKLWQGRVVCCVKSTEGICGFQNALSQS